MTVRDRATEFLLANLDSRLCDACLARALGVHASTGHRAAAKLERSERFERAYGPCTACGEERLVTRALG